LFYTIRIARVEGGIVLVTTRRIKKRLGLEHKIIKRLESHEKESMESIRKRDKKDDK
jgi:hypothetical protein